MTAPAATIAARRWVIGHVWVLALAPLALMVASDYKLRLRDPTATIGGRPDAVVLAELVVYALVGLLLVAAVSAAGARRPEPLLVAAWCFAGFMAASALYAPYPKFALARGAEWLVLILLAQTLARRADRRHLHRIAHGFVVLVIASICLGTLHRYPAVGPVVEGRFTWLYVHPVVSAIYMGAAVVISVCYLAFRARPGTHLWPRWLYGLAAAVALAGLLASKTRAAAAGCVVGAALAYLLAVDPRRRSAAVVVGLCLVAIVAVLAGGQVSDFATRHESSAQLASLNFRTTLWHLAYDAFRAHPIGGYGLTSSHGIFLAATGLGGGHNALVNVLVDGGVVGAALWLTLVISLLVYALRLLRRRDERLRIDLALVLGVLSFLVVDSLTTEGLSAPANVASVWLAVLVGWCVVLVRRPGQEARSARSSPGPRSPG